MRKNATDREYLLSLGATPEQIDQFNKDIQRALNMIEDAKPIALNIATPSNIGRCSGILAPSPAIQCLGITFPLRHSFETSTTQPTRELNNESHNNGFNIPDEFRLESLYVHDRSEKEGVNHTVHTYLPTKNSARKVDSNLSESEKRKFHFFK